MKYRIMVVLYIQLPGNEERRVEVHWKDEEDYVTAHNICAEFNVESGYNTFAIVRENKE